MYVWGHFLLVSLSNKTRKGEWQPQKFEFNSIILEHIRGERGKENSMQSVTSEITGFLMHGPRNYPHPIRPPQANLAIRIWLRLEIHTHRNRKRKIPTLGHSPKHSRITPNPGEKQLKNRWEISYDQNNHDKQSWATHSSNPLLHNCRNWRLYTSWDCRQK